MGLTNPEGRKRYIAAAFPSACGKTNLAMLTPPANLPGWKVECVGDDIAWMKFNQEDGTLRAINPENGFFGVAPGTNMSSNPNAMRSIFKNTIFTNTARTSDGGVYWEDMEWPEKGVSITSWKDVENWEELPREERKKKENYASHANARFCSPIAQYPFLDAEWESSEGVPIDAILFGGRRPDTIPLVYEAYNWQHGVFVGAGMKSETTAAAMDAGSKMAHDPFAMRPFFGYNFIHYLEHWLGLEGRAEREGLKLPKIFHVNWFRKDDSGAYVWPGFGENLRVLDWVLRRCDGEDVATETPLGYVPSEGVLNLDGLGEGQVRREWLFRQDREELLRDLAETEEYFASQFPGQLPPAVLEEVESLRQRILKM